MGEEECQIFTHVFVLFVLMSRLTARHIFFSSRVHLFDYKTSWKIRIKANWGIKKECENFSADYIVIYVFSNERKETSFLPNRIRWLHDKIKKLDL